MSASRSAGPVLLLLAMSSIAIRAHSVSLMAADSVRTTGGPSQIREDSLLSRIQELVLDTRTASWTQTTWETDGEDEEWTAARCLWVGQDNQRLDVYEGRGAGATAILYDGRVHGFKRGFLSFIKKTFDPEHARVVSLRGNSMTANGFLDDLEWMSDHWELVSVSRDSTRTIVSYEEAGVKRRYVLLEDPIRVAQQETYEADRLVERYTYSDVSYNIPVKHNDMRP